MGNETGGTSGPQHCKGQVEYFEESEKPAETGCHSDFSEKLLIKTGGKNSQE